MFIEERHQAILDILAQNGSITNALIQEKFGVSYDSAKRDLRLLEEQGLLKRTHGGAIPIRQVAAGKPAKIMNRDMPSVKENYLAIAKRAASMIQNNDTVFITAASVGYLLAQNIPTDIRFRAVTNSIEIAEILRPLDNVIVILLGGEMDAKGMCRDSFTEEMVKRLRFDKAFVTAAAISPEFGLSIQRATLGVINAVMDNTRQTIGLFPTEKIGMDSVVSICPATRLDILITDWDAAESDLKGFDELGVKVEIVEK